MVRTHGTVVGRMLMGLLFVFSGIGIYAEQTIVFTAAYYDSLGIPLAWLLVYVVIFVKIVGGGALMFGYRTGMAAGALIVFTIIATLAAHMSLEDINLFKNLAIIGGLLYVMAYGPGEGWSLVDRKSNGSSLGDKDTVPIDSTNPTSQSM